MKYTRYLFLIISLAVLPVACKKKDSTTANPDSGNEPLASPLPVIETNTLVSAIGESVATVGGILKAEGSSTVQQAGICWDVKPQPTVAGNHSVVSKASAGFTLQLNNLLPNSTYYVRAYATNASGTAYGNQVMFKTSSKWLLSYEPYSDYIKTIFTVDSTVFILSSANAIYRKTEGAATWDTLITGINNGVTALCRQGNNLFAGSNGGGVYLSTDMGQTWQQKNNGLANSQGVVSSITCDGNNLLVVMRDANADALYASGDGGTNWLALNTTPNTRIENALKKDNVVIANVQSFGGSIASGIYISQDNGSTWIASKVGYFYNLLLLGNNVIMRDNNANVFLSSDNGSTWQSASVGLPSNFYIEAMAVDNNSIYVAKAGAINVSENNGQTYTEIKTNGLPSGELKAMNASAKSLYISLKTNGLFARPLN